MSAHGTGTAAPSQSDNPFIRTVGIISSACGAMSAALIVVSVVITCQMIFVRFVLRESTIWQTEAVIYMMITATLLGLPYVQKLRGHVNVDLLPLMVRGRARLALAWIVLGASLGVVALMLWHGWHMFSMAWDRGWRSDTVWGVELWIPYIAVPLGLGLYALQLAADLVGLATRDERPFGLAEDETLIGELDDASAIPRDSAIAHDMADATTGAPGASPEAGAQRRVEPVQPPRFSKARGSRRTTAP